MEQRFGWCPLQRKVGSVETMTLDRSLARIQTAFGRSFVLLGPQAAFARLLSPAAIRLRARLAAT